MKNIPLTQGQFAIIDDADFALINTLKWHAHFNPCTRTFYAKRNFTKTNGKQTADYLHWYIAGHSLTGFRVDHINGNSLDNRRCNLRVVNPRINSLNSRKRRNSEYTSKYPGVYWNNGRKRWQTQIKKKGKPRYLGIFDNEEDAAKAYQNAIETA